jgi:hypothetical protein
MSLHTAVRTQLLEQLDTPPGGGLEATQLNNALRLLAK